jgi:hypothetical protein
MYTTREIGLCFFAALILSGCAARRYQPVPIVPTETASRLETRSLGDEGLHAFVARQPALAPAEQRRPALPVLQADVIPLRPEDR